MLDIKKVYSIFYKIFFKNILFSILEVRLFDERRFFTYFVLREKTSATSET